MFTTGGLLAPLLARPFLLEHEDDDEDQESSVKNSSSYFNGTLTNITRIPFEYSPDDVLVQWPFTIVGVIFILAAIGFLLFYFFIPSESTNSVNVNRSQQVNPPPDNIISESIKLDRLPSSDYQYNFDIKVKILIISLISVFSHIYFGVIISFGKLITTLIMQIIKT